MPVPSQADDHSFGFNVASGSTNESSDFEVSYARRSLSGVSELPKLGSAQAGGVRFGLDTYLFDCFISNRRWQAKA